MAYSQTSKTGPRVLVPVFSPSRSCQHLKVQAGGCLISLSSVETGRRVVRVQADDQNRWLEDLRAVWSAAALGNHLFTNISLRPARGIKAEAYSPLDVSLFSHVVRLILPPLLHVFGAPGSFDNG